MSVLVKNVSLYSEVRIYDPSGDSTIPSTSKKRKFEEVAQEDAPETPAAKTKKSKKEPVIGVWNGKRKLIIGCTVHDAKILCVF